MELEVKKSLYEFIENRTMICKILVVGDIMLDKYYYGEVSRISPEAPVPINHVVKIKNTLGGAANVAHNISLLGAEISLIGRIGKDHHAENLRDKLSERGIDPLNLIETHEPTTTKIRVIGGHQQMLRLDFENVLPADDEQAEQILKQAEEKIHAGANILIISDYGKGICTEKICQSLIDLCIANNVRVIVDPKGTRWEKYSRANYITPNFSELNSVLDSQVENVDSAIESAGKFIMKKFSIENVLATRSSHGLSLISPAFARHIPTKAQEVFDVSGAGDTVIAVFSLALAGGLEPIAAAYLANLAASVVVAKVGTYAVSRDELLKRIEQSMKKSKHI